MTSQYIRQAYLDFFKNKQHEIVPAAPVVVKNDPTLMFNNAGMNQFKDLFLGEAVVKFPRIADTQPCLRVSGKHNDLEEVGIDTYHHTLFEMLGNWSFGDYFKKEAIEWAWELLTEVYKIEKDRLYVTIFEGDKEDGIEKDHEAYEIWKGLIAEDRILLGNKKDNFWEMGDTGPCGPCSEIHVDMRNDQERAQLDGKELVNADHPQVIEIWNLVFMQFNRLKDGSLKQLPNKHVDTGMGFERLVRVIQGKTSNYDTDVFTPYINFIEEKSGIKYGDSENTDIAMRVISDHIRAIGFTIADGQLPSNNKAGYVIRRILRRAVRYAYTFLNFNEPFIHTLVPVLAKEFKGVFNQIEAQQDFIQQIVLKEEESFYRTLVTGVQRFENYLENNLQGSQVIEGKFAFELYDTYGFPIDLTELLAREKGLQVDLEVFEASLEEQKNRSRAATNIDTGDWVVLSDDESSEFVGYDSLTAQTHISKYRKIAAKGKDQYQVVLSVTPFYAEGGGQVGDVGYLESLENGQKVSIVDTKKENGLTVHFLNELPLDINGEFNAVVNATKRKDSERNHSATHLLHAALKEVLGDHVAQKGSLVNSSVLRFDISHFSKVTEEEIRKVEDIVNEKIRQNIVLDERRSIPLQQALDEGVTGLFGEKYGEFVRVITFDPHFSRELCGGTHVKSTGEIGFFKITSESAVAAGVRRIEAVTGTRAEQIIHEHFDLIQQIRTRLNNPKDFIQALNKIVEDNAQLRKEIEKQILEKALQLKNNLLGKVIEVNGINFLAAKIELSSAEAIKSLAYSIRAEIPNLFLVLGAVSQEKPNLTVMISDNLVGEKGFDAGKIVRELAKEIQGGGGGQAFYATAGGKNLSGLESAISKAKDYIK